MEQITLYSTGCPKCRVLEKKLNDKNIEYVINDDIDAMTKLGIRSVPQLQLGNMIFDFNEARKMIDTYDGSTMFGAN